MSIGITIITEMLKSTTVLPNEMSPRVFSIINTLVIPKAYFVEMLVMMRSINEFISNLITAHNFICYKRMK